MQPQQLPPNNQLQITREFRFKVFPDCPSKDVAARVAQIVMGTDSYYLEERGAWIERYALGGSNDWWLTKAGEHEYWLVHRYGFESQEYGSGQPGFMTALKMVVIWALGVERLNGVDPS